VAGRTCTLDEVERQGTSDAPSVTVVPYMHEELDRVAVRTPAPLLREGRPRD